MKSGIFSFLTKPALTLFFSFWLVGITAQNNNDFWKRVRFGGSFGLGIGNGYTDITLAPGAMYPINEYFGVGASIQGSYIKQKDYFTSYLYGGSVVGLFNPIPQIQLSAEVEQLRVNIDGEDYLGTYERNFWNTALFFGVGYRAENVTIGLRYNVLFRENDRVYSDALMPFIRVYF